MIVNEEILSELYEVAGDTRYQGAMKLVKEKNVTITKVLYEDKNNFDLDGKVEDTKEEHHITISVKKSKIENIECTCLDNHQNYCTCKHILAVMIEFVNNPIYEGLYTKKTVDLQPKQIGKGNYRNFKQMIHAFYQEEVETYETKEEMTATHKVKIFPEIWYDQYSKEMKLELKIGEEKLYKIKSLSDFYTRMLEKEKYRYGTKLEFVHDPCNFVPESKELLEFVLKQAEIIKYVNSSGNTGYRYYGKVLNDNFVLLSNTGLDEFFEIMKGKTIAMHGDSEENKIKLIPAEPNITFKLEQINSEEFIFAPSIQEKDYSLLEGKEYIYFLLDDMLYRCEKEFKHTTFKLLEIFRKNFVQTIKFSKKELPDFFSLIVPKLKESIIIENILPEVREKYIPKELRVKVYLDYDKNNYIIADVKFCYGDYEFNPIDIEKEHKIARNVVQETECLNLFRKTGFLLDSANLRFILVSDDSIYHFLSEDIEEYMKRFEVLVTDNFKTKEIRQPKLGTIGVKIENNLLDIDLTGLEFDRTELKEILAKYNIRKKYHRLKDGSFIDLEQNEDIQFLNSLEYGMEVDYKDLERGKIKVPLYRTLYLNKILENLKHIEIQKNQEYKDLVNQIHDKEIENTDYVPKGLKCQLRYYQKIGYRWLKVLNQYQLGGILADDMGLGKTVQVLALLLDYLENTPNPIPSLVVTPSSLALNWKSEIEKFAPEIKVLVMGGNIEERKEKIKQISNYDLIVTSYDLLKRDIDFYEENDIHFYYQIADEAQYIKNSHTQNAKALKRIYAHTKFALTGTPIENSLAELWSIFDYIMSGYLFTYKKFKQIYEIPIMRDNDEEASKKLKMMIEPFILRRIKKEVLKELPEKSVTILNNEMEEEQQKIYMSYLSQARTEAMKEIKQQGFEKSQIKILALLTRLRQICCHPSLFIENYQSGSSKLTQCIELVKDAVEGGHKILIFSGYTSMFKIIEGHLKKENIKYYKLTGQTKVEERIGLVDDFNKNEEVKVFLISLKAGGTGLNLIGADMVIHYDPWWNMSAENQATDRAYRIGQKNNVQVYKLITKNSIEEKIYELQEKKAKLIDQMIGTETTFISQLSKDEIMSLFE